MSDYGMTGGSSATPAIDVQPLAEKKLSPMEQSFSQLHIRLNALECVLEHLSVRLAPVMKPVNTSDKVPPNGTETRPMTSEMVRFVEQKAWEVQALETRVKAMLDALEV